MTDSLTVRVETDAGPAYLKVMNSRGTPHTLACELVGTALAQWVGLPTLEYSVIDVPAVAPLDLYGGASFIPGPGFITREMAGMAWSGQMSELKSIVNPQDIGKLVAFDTWTLNCDRFRPAHPGGAGLRSNPGNVFLHRDRPADVDAQLIAIDHGHCFKCDNDLTPAYLGRVAADRTLFGLFPGFGGLARREDALAAADRLQCITPEEIESIINAVPPEWVQDHRARVALADLVYRRSQFVRGILEAELPRADLLDDLPRRSDDP